MAVARWLETDTNTNLDISSAVSIGVYTADADRMIVVDVSLDAVAGSGDYVIYLTRRINGAGSSYVLLPKTTCTAAAGETAIAMQSGPVTVRSGDVVTCYIDGLAGDDTTPDTTVRWFEMATLRPATADRTAVVDANGLIDALAVKVGPTGAGTAQTARDLGASVLLSSGTGTGQLDFTSGVVKANLAQILGTALTETAGYLAAAFKKFFNVATPVSTTESVNQTGDSFARLGAPVGASVSADIAAIDSDVWTYASRTLTSTAAATASAVDGSTLVLSLTATYAATLSGLTIPATWTKLWWTLKDNATDADAAAVLQLIVSNPAAGTTDGTLYVLATAATAGQRTLGTLTVSQAGGTVAIALDETLTAALAERGSLVYDIKVLESGGAATILTAGLARIERTVTWAVT